MKKAISFAKEKKIMKGNNPEYEKRTYYSNYNSDSNNYNIYYNPELYQV